MKAEPKSNGSTPAADPDTYFTVLISPVMEREFKRRDIFPELRLETAVRIQNGATGVHKVSVERAKEVLADAQAMEAHNRDLPRGIPVAYGALERNLTASLKQEARRGIWDDPGMDEMRNRAAQSPACFDVGDAVLYFSDDAEYGQKATIVGGYEMYSVTCEDGPYMDSKGQRLEYKRGYAIKCNGSDHRFFCPAHCLTGDDCEPAYLRLVASRPAAAF